MQWEYLPVQFKENQTAEGFFAICAKAGLDGWQLCCPVSFMEQLTRMNAKGLIEQTKPMAMTYLFFMRPLAPGDVRDVELVTTREDHGNLLPPRKN